MCSRSQTAGGVRRMLFSNAKGRSPPHRALHTRAPVYSPLNETAMAVTGTSGDSSPDAATNLRVDPGTLSCGGSKTRAKSMVETFETPVGSRDRPGAHGDRASGR